MNLYRLELKLTSPMGSPLVGPQIFGMVCQVFYDISGEAKLKKWLSTPEQTWRISDSFPSHCLPKPQAPPQYLSNQQFDSFKKRKKCPWILRETWIKYRNSWSESKLADDELVSVPKEPLRLAHNIINRQNNRTLKKGGLFFVEEDWSFNVEKKRYVDLYIQAPESKEQVLRVISEIGQRGYGRDASTGRGRFEVTKIYLDHELTDLPDAVRRMSLSRGVYTPSTMQDAYWKIEPHYGRVGPNLSLAGVSPFKYPVLLTVPGTTFIPKGVDIPGKWVTGVHPSRPEICLNGFHLSIPYKEEE